MLVLLVVASVVAPVTPPGRWLARRALGAWRLRLRARLPPEPPPFQRLAASQLGYAPAMEKRFSAPGRFDTFRVVRLEDGHVVLTGGPACRLATTELGPVPEVTVGDFSALSAPGRYRLEAGPWSSEPFDVRADVYDAALRAAQRGFYFQRAFTAVEARHAHGPWTHPSDAALAPPGVRGGWHDAGDFSLYSASTNSALYWLLQTWVDVAPADDDTGVPESGNGLPDLLDEARWGLAWLLSVQAPSGAFANSTCQTRYGPYGTNRPESAAPYVQGEPGTLATARAVGTLGFAASVYRPLDPSFAEEALAAARRGWAWLRTHPETSDGPTCPAYRADGDRRAGEETRLYAAAGLLLATGEPAFRDDFARHLVEPVDDPSFRSVAGFAARLYLRAPGRDEALAVRLQAVLDARAARTREAGRRDPFERSAPRFWGSLAAGFIRTGSASVPRCLADPVAAAGDCRQALANVHHALGRNLLGLSYVSGLPGVTRARQHAFHHWLAALDASPWLFPGMIAGGPNASPEPDDVSSPGARPRPTWGYAGDPAFPRDARTPYEARFTDNDSWSTNEVSLDWQAATVHALAVARWLARHPPPAGPPSEVRPVSGGPDGALPACDTALAP